MPTWVYFAASSQAGQASTVNFALANHVIYRPSRTATGSLTPRVGDLRAGDRILLAYRQPSASPIVQLCARIASAANPVPGTQVIEQIGLPFSQQLFAAEYPPVASGVGEIIHLEEVHLCQFPLQGNYLGRNALRDLAPQDSRFGLLHYFRASVHDNDQNQHNRDVFAADCNARIGGGPGPFWGCTAGAIGPHLTMRRVGVFTFPNCGMEEYRVTERKAREEELHAANEEGWILFV